MDPLSIITGAVALTQTLVVVSKSLSNFVKQTKTVNESIKELQTEVDGLQYTASAIESALKQPSVQGQASHMVIDVWYCVHMSISRCQNTSKDLEALLSKTISKDGAWNRLKNQFRFDRDSVAKYKNQYRDHSTCLQLALQTIHIYMTCQMPAQFDRLSAQIEQGTQAILAVREARSSIRAVASPTPGGDIPLDMIEKSAQRIISSASIIVESSSTGGSVLDYQVEISDELRDNMSQWLKGLPSVMEGSDDDVSESLSVNDISTEDTPDGLTDRIDTNSALITAASEPTTARGEPGNAEAIEAAPLFDQARSTAQASSRSNEDADTEDSGSHPSPEHIKAAEVARTKCLEEFGDRSQALRQAQVLITDLQDDQASIQRALMRVSEPPFWVLDTAKVVRALIACGADVNAVTTYDHSLMSPLMSAVRYSKGHVEKAALLFELGADPNVLSPGWKPHDSRAGYRNMSALHIACGCAVNCLGLVKLLIQHGAKVNACHTDEHEVLCIGPSNVTALHRLANWYDPECADIAKVLIAAGADVNMKTSVGWTALDVACCRPNEFTPLLVQVLLSAGTEINEPDGNGSSALDSAQYCLKYYKDNGMLETLQKQHVEKVIDILLEHGAIANTG